MWCTDGSTMAYCLGVVGVRGFRGVVGAVDLGMLVNRIGGIAGCDRRRYLEKRFFDFWIRYELVRP